jgi:mediator of RNA polymerase II transcription subunit 12
VLQALEALDLHSFDRVDLTNRWDHLIGLPLHPVCDLSINIPFSIDSLYVKIFPAIGGNKGNVDPATVEQIGQFAKQDEPFVRLLCQWAVSDQRYGEHRAIAAALLLEKRQMDLVALTESDAVGGEDNDTDENLAAVSAVQPVYQVCLIVIFFS